MLQLPAARSRRKIIVRIWGRFPLKLHILWKNVYTQLRMDVLFILYGPLLFFEI